VISFPSFALKIKGVKKTNRVNKEFKNRVKKFKKYFVKVMLKPKRYDKVYKACQEIFEFKSNLNLKRPDKKRYEIRRLAKKRFMLGYPPRKNNDITIGDAINWEWIIACCNKEEKDVVIVSRDSDYGITYNRRSSLNDWLKEEFKSRISPRRGVILTNKLSEGLKKLSVSISKRDEEAESNLSSRVNKYTEFLQPTNYQETCPDCDSRSVIEIEWSSNFDKLISDKNALNKRAIKCQKCGEISILYTTN
jgi:hypothetical protein